MKYLKSIKYLFFVCLYALSINQSIANQIININEDWTFYKSAHDLQESDLARASWKSVFLPHTPRLESKIIGSQWQGIAWYEKKITALPEWQSKKVFVEFEAAMRVADVWINGTHVFHHVGGYLPFTIDLSDQLIFDSPNTLRVKLNNYDNPVSGPKPLEQLDFNFYGGIYRNVNLIIKPRLYITDPIAFDEKRSGGVYVNYSNVTEKSAQIHVATHVKNEFGESANFTIRQSLSLENEEIDATESSFTLGISADNQFNQKISIDNPDLWHPNSPRLYKLTTQILRNGELIDSAINNIGIRSITFDDENQLLVNGTQTFLRGINRHQEYPYVGYALSDNAQYRDAVKIKSAGFDYVRVAHYPMSKAFMRAADELGLLVLNAIPGWQYASKSEQFNSQVLQTCRDMIRRDRNHPSVLAWECSLNETGMPQHMVDRLHNVVKEETVKDFSAGWVPSYDIFIQARQHRLPHYVTPTQPYLVSEYGDWEYYAQNAGLAQDTWSDLKAEDRTSRQLLSDGQTRLLQQVTNIQEAHNDNFRTPAFADGYWVMFDYNRGYADDLEASGIMSIDRLPKYSYYFFQSQRPAKIDSADYQSGPMVFIASEWNNESPLNVSVFSNAERVELSLNGKLIASKATTNASMVDNLNSPPFTFPISKFEAGALLANAYIDEKLVAQHKVVTAKEPKSIELRLDLSGVPLLEGTRDLVFVYAQLNDGDGNKTAINFNEIEFETRGDVQLVNTGPTLTENGIAAALIRVGPDLNSASIAASSIKYSLKSKTLKLND